MGGAVERDGSWIWLCRTTARHSADLGRPYERAFGYGVTVGKAIEGTKVFP
ncbi:hypothetical protein JOE52_006787 [Bradyrhizobium canariense]|nr:hypothetical protein [Bradyrhizobium canariense]